MVDELKLRVSVSEELGNVDHDLINIIIQSLKYNTPASLYSPTRKIYVTELMDIVNSLLNNPLKIEPQA